MAARITARGSATVEDHKEWFAWSAGDQGRASIEIVPLLRSKMAPHPRSDASTVIVRSHSKERSVIGTGALARSCKSQTDNCDIDLSSGRGAVDDQPEIWASAAIRR